VDGRAIGNQKWFSYYLTWQLSVNVITDDSSEKPGEGKLADGWQLPPSKSFRNVYKMTHSLKHPQRMTNPIPFPFLYLNINWLLICDCPEVFI
jgi:hypothetical protein